MADISGGRGARSRPSTGDLRIISAPRARANSTRREFGLYEALAAARASRQLSDAAWNSYLEKDDFAAWYLADLLQH